MTYYFIFISVLTLLSGCTSKKIKTQKELENEMLNQELESEINNPNFNSIFTDGCSPSPYVSGCLDTSKPTIQNTNPNDKDEIERQKKEAELAKKLRDALNKNP